MKITRTETLMSSGYISETGQWPVAMSLIHEAVQSIDWPTGSGKFIINPASSDHAGTGNGTLSMIAALREEIQQQGWRLDQTCMLPAPMRAGKLDAISGTVFGMVAAHFQLGSPSSAHRAMNSIVLSIMSRRIVIGIFVLPSKALAHLLDGKVGSFADLEPYFSMWRTLGSKAPRGILHLVEVEQDGISESVPKIPHPTS